MPFLVNGDCQIQQTYLLNFVVIDQLPMGSTYWAEQLLDVAVCCRCGDEPSGAECPVPLGFITYLKNLEALIDTEGLCLAARAHLGETS